MKSNKKGIKRILKAFTYSFDGFKSVFETEEAFKQELFLCIFLFIVIILLKITYLEKLLLISSLFFIIIAELINTAIEVVIDRISDEYHILSKKAKDIGSLLVLIAFIYATIVWGVIIYNNLNFIF